jgi:hypothetical protein
MGCAETCRLRLKKEPQPPGCRSSHLISIDHNNRVLVGFSARENYSLATREHPGLSFHILRFTPAGKIDLSLVLPTRDNFTNGLYLGANDQILARANDVLQVLPAATKTDGEDVTWQPLAPCQVIVTLASPLVAAR